LLDTDRGNVDVEVKLADGRRFALTFFTLANITQLMDRWGTTGECRNGLYFWASDAVVVRTLTRETIADTVRGLLVTSEIEDAGTLLK
jgi:hypothetical protein